MNYIDIIILVLVGFAVYKGFENGFIIEIAQVIGLIFALYGAAKFSSGLAYLLESYLKPSMVATISFIVVFLIILIVIMIFAKIISAILDKVALGFINKLFGAIFGGVKAIFIISILLLAFNAMSPDKTFLSSDTANGSYFYEYINYISETLFPFLEFETIKESVTSTIS